MSGEGFLSQHPVLFITSAPLASYMTRRPHHIFKRLNGWTKVINVSWSRSKAQDSDEFGDSRVFTRLPGERFGFIRKLNRKLYRRHFEKIVKSLDAEPILWVWGKPMPWLWKHLPRAGLIYELTDYMPGFAHQSHLKKEVETMMSAADLVFAVSRPLWKWAASFNRNCFLVPNGVDPAEFSSAANETDKRAVAYWGAFSHWLDMELLTKVAQGLADVELRLAGRPHPGTQAQLDNLVQLPNVRFFGELDYHRLPEFLAPVAVGLVPFSREELSFSASPLKIYEAWAAGAGVVSTPLDDAILHQEEGVLQIAQTPEDFIGAVRTMLRSRKPQRLAEKARENSWDERFQMVLDALSEVF